MAVLTVLMLLCAMVASNALNPLSEWLLNPTKLIDITKGVLSNGLTMCNNYTYLNVPAYMTEGLHYVQTRTARPGQEEFRCGTSRVQTIFSTNLEIRTFEGIFLSGPFKWKYLAVALDNGQFRSFDLADPSGDITFNMVAFECNAGHATVMCRWDTTAPTTIYFTMVTKEKFPNATLVKRLMESARNASVPLDNLIYVNQTGCPPPKPYKPLTVWDLGVLTIEILFSISL